MHVYACKCLTLFIYVYYLYIRILAYMYVYMYVCTSRMYACGRRLLLRPFPRVLLRSRDTWSIGTLLVDTRALFNGCRRSQLHASVCLPVCLHLTAPPIHKQLITLVTCYKPSYHKTNRTSTNVHPMPVEKFPRFPTVTGDILSDILNSLSLRQLCLLTFLY